MAETFTLQRSCRVTAARADVWQFVTSLDGINHELMPLVRMTTPRGFQDQTVADVRPGQTIGRSWLLLGGILPLESSKISIAELDDGERFLERSTMLVFSTWQHERSLDTVDDTTTVVTDSIEFEPRIALPGLGRVTERVVSALFAYRHRRLTAFFSD